MTWTGEMRTRNVAAGTVLRRMLQLPMPPGVRHPRQGIVIHSTRELEDHVWLMRVAAVTLWCLGSQQRANTARKLPGRLSAVSPRLCSTSSIASVGVLPRPVLQTAEDRSRGIGIETADAVGILAQSNLNAIVLTSHHPRGEFTTGTAAATAATGRLLVASLRHLVW